MVKLATNFIFNTGAPRAKFDALNLALLTCYLVVLVVHDDDKAGEEGRRYIAGLRSRTERIISLPPPAHDLTDFWKSGGDLRGWAAGHVAQELSHALIGMSAETPLMESWQRILEIAEKETGFVR